MLDKHDLYKLILSNYNEILHKNKDYAKNVERDLSFAKNLMNRVVKNNEYKPNTKNFRVRPENYDAFAVALMVTLSVNRNNSNLTKILETNYSNFIEGTCEKIINAIHSTNGFNKKYLDHYLVSFLLKNINLKNRIKKIIDDNKKATIEKVNSGLHFYTYYGNMVEKLLVRKVMYGTIIDETAEELYQIILNDIIMKNENYNKVYICNTLIEEKETIINLLNSLVLELNHLINEHQPMID